MFKVIKQNPIYLSSFWKKLFGTEEFNTDCVLLNRKDRASLLGF